MLEASPAEAGPTGKVRERPGAGSGGRWPPCQAKYSGSRFSLQLPRAGSGSGYPRPVLRAAALPCGGGGGSGSVRRAGGDPVPGFARGRLGKLPKLCGEWRGPARPSCGPAGGMEQHGRAPLPGTGTGLRARPGRGAATARSRRGHGWALRGGRGDPRFVRPPPPRSAAPPLSGGCGAGGVSVSAGAKKGGRTAARGDGRAAPRREPGVPRTGNGVSPGRRCLCPGLGRPGRGAALGGRGCAGGGRGPSFVSVGLGAPGWSPASPVPGTPRAGGRAREVFAEGLKGDSARLRSPCPVPAPRAHPASRGSPGQRGHGQVTLGGPDEFLVLIETCLHRYSLQVILPWF